MSLLDDRPVTESTPRTPVFPLPAATAGPVVTGWKAWRFVVPSIAALASVTTTVLVHVTAHNLLWGDEPSHLLHARRFFDSLTPGFGQLGNYWPPLIHWAELPFAWNAWMVRTDLAGQIPAMFMFVVAAMGAYALGVELTNRRGLGVLAALVLIANPNMLYLQSSAMMESGIVMTLTWVSVWLLRFRRSGRFRDVVHAGAWSALAVFATWAALVLPVYGGLIVAAACRQHRFDWSRTKVYVAAYSALCGYAVALWLGWNWYLKNDPLYMVHFRHPDGGAPQPAHTALTKLHPDLWRGLLSFGSAALDNVGPAVFVVAGIVLVVGLLRGQLLHPLGVTLLGGLLVLTEWSHGEGGLSGSPTFALLAHLKGRDATGLNVRYALWVLPFMAGAVALAARRYWSIRLLVVSSFVLSSVWFLPEFRGVVTLHSADMVTQTAETHIADMAARLHNDCRGGQILTSASGGGDRLILLSGLPGRDFVTEFNARAYSHALRSPGLVRYVLLDHSLNDHLPESVLIADGFTMRWTTTVDGYPLSLWGRSEGR